MTPFPVQRRSLEEWIASRSGEVKGATMHSYVAGVRSYQVDLGLPVPDDVFHHPRLRRIIDGARNIFGEAPRRDRYPLTRDILVRILSFPLISLDGPLDYLDVDAHLEARALRASFTLAFAAFLRIGEFTYSPLALADWSRQSSRLLTRQAVTISSTGDALCLVLPQSKTDPSRKGVTLVVARSDPGDIACPVQAMVDYFASTAHFALPGSPLFFRTNASHTKLLPWTRAYVLRRLALCLEQAGIDARGFSGHSFRRGAATTAAHNNLGGYEIQLLGRWKSDAYKAYIDTPPAQLHALSRRLQGHFDPLSPLPPLPSHMPPPARY